MKTTTDYTLIGGGIQSLLIAHEISKKYPTATINILEANPNLGGLLTDIQIGHTTIESFYHHLLPTDNATIQLCTELNLDHELLWFPATMSMYDQGRFWNFNTAWDLLKYSRTSLLGRLGIGYCLLRMLLTKNAHATQTAKEIVKHWTGTAGYQALWEPLLYGKFHEHAADVAFPWLLERIRTRGKGPRTRKGKLGYLHGGLGRLVQQLQQNLSKNHNITIKLNSHCIDLQHCDTNWQVLTKEHSYSSKNVIITIPNTKIKNWSAVKKIQAWCATTTYLGAICILWQADKTLLPAYWNNILDRTLPFVVAIEHTKLAPTAWYQNKHLGYLGAYLPTDHPLLTQPDNYAITEFYRTMARLTPDTKAIKILNIARAHYAQHVVSPNWLINKPTNFAIDHHLFLANFAMIYPADRGINYAIEQAKRLVAQL